MKKLVSILLILTVIATCFCACGDDDVAMVMPIDADPLCLDPQIVETDSGRLVVTNCFEGLVRLDKDYKIIPGVAESWTVSADGLVYTFKLREDSKWQLLKSYKDVLPDENYEETFDTRVTAGDFQFGLRRAIDPNTQCNEAEKLFCIKNAQAINSGNAAVESLGVTAPDDSTLVITLERANPDFLRLLTLPSAMPCKEAFFKETHAKYGLAVKYTFCNGPFYLSKWADDNSLVIRKNEGYRGNSKTAVSAVYFNVNKDEASVITKVKQNSYDIAKISSSAKSELKDAKSVKFATVENTVSGLCFNCKDSLLSDVNVRKALLMITLTGEIEKPDSAAAEADGVVPQCCRFGEKAYREAAGKITGIAYNEATALTLWQKAVKDAGADSLEIKIICTSDYTAQMQNVIQNWQKVLGTSIIAKVETLEDADFDKAVKNGTYQIAVGKLSADSSTPIDFLKKFRGDSKANIFGYSSEAFDKLTDKIVLEDAGDAILADYIAAERMLVSDAVFSPLHLYSRYAAVNGDVEGVYPLPAFESFVFVDGRLN